MLILTINLGNTSSKIAVFHNDEEQFSETIRHEQELLARHKLPKDQFAFRQESIREVLQRHGYGFEEFDAVCSRAGLLRPIESGTYQIDDAVLRDASDIEIGGRQALGLGLIIAKSIQDTYGIPAYFCDPVSTDELTDIARVTGFRPFERISRFHALNQKAVARQCAEAIGKPYEELNLIGVHMGGGVSVAAHQRGRCVDMYDCSEEGAFSMDWGGNLPTTQIVDYCFSAMNEGKTAKDIKFTLKREAGVLSYVGTSDMREVEERMEAGDAEAKRIYEAFAFQHARCIGAEAAVLGFQVDGIFFTGGIAFSRKMCDLLKSYIGDLAPVYEFPGEEEMRALALGALRVLEAKATAKTYPWQVV